MNELAIHIEYLLLSHNCVIVPQLGAFRADNTPARWIDSENLYMPPIRNVHFNPLINVDRENILINSIAEIFNLSQDEAEKQCEEMVAKFHNVLMSEGTLDFGSIGVFTYEEDGTITMDSCECGVINPSYYGIDALHIQKQEINSSTDLVVEHIDDTTATQNIDGKDDASIEETNEVAVGNNDVPMKIVASAENVDNTVRVRRTPTRPTESHLIFSISRKIVNYSIAVASIVALIFIVKPTEIKTYAGTPANGQLTSFIKPKMSLEASNTTAFTNDYESELKDSFDAVLLDMTEEANNEGFSMTENTETESAATVEETAKTVSSEVSNTVEQISSNTVRTSKVATTAEAKVSNYCIVLASCVSRANAESFVSNLNKRNIKASVMEKNDLRRVVVDGFSTQEEAYRYMKTIKQNNDDISSAWVLKL